MSEQISVQTENDTCVISLTGELNIYTAAELKDELVTLVRDNETSSLNLANVQDIDTAGLQILVLLKQEATQLNHQLTYTNHSQPVVNVIELLDMVSLFGDPIVLTD